MSDLSTPMQQADAPPAGKAQQEKQGYIQDPGPVRKNGHYARVDLN